MGKGNGSGWVWSKESKEGAGGRADPGGMAGPGLTQTEMVSDLWSDGIISNILNIAKTPNAKKALFLTAILLGTPVAAALLTSCDDGNTKPENNQPPVDEYDTIQDFMTGGFAFLNDGIITVKVKKGINFAPEIRSNLATSIARAVRNQIVYNYLINDDRSKKHEIVVLVDDSGMNPSLSADGIHIPLTYLENNIYEDIAGQLINLITELSSRVAQSKQFAQSVAAQAKASFFANSKTARQQAALLAKYTARSNARHA
jgi:hypothetical protein